MKFNEELKNARQNLKLTQKAISEMLGVPLRTYEDWEAGRRNPPEFTKKTVIEKANEAIKSR